MTTADDEGARADAEAGVEQAETGRDIEAQDNSVSAMLSGPDRLLLEEFILPKFLLLQRWFAAKDKTIGKTSLSLLAEIGEGGQALTALDVDFDGGSHRYLLPLAILWDSADQPSGSPHKLATLRRGEVAGALIDGASDPDFANLLMRQLRSGATIEAADGQIMFRTTDSLVSIGESGPPRMLGADQSNVSIVFGDSLILKIYRRLRAGPQPDVEMARFLTGTAGFAHTPAFLGSIEHRAGGGEATTLAAAFAFVPNQGDAWQAVTKALQREAAFTDASDVEGAGPFPLDIGELLGRRTAEMHRALATATDDPAFAVQPTTAADIDAWTRAAVLDVEEMIASLEGADLAGEAGLVADAVLDSREEIFRKIAAVSSMPPGGGQSRIHGDYHLGQVLVADGDLMIIDFEGEPRRPLEERTAKSSPLRDVAGMLRSLDYAAAAATAEEQTDAAGSDAANPAMRWRDTASAAFLAAYGEHIAGCRTYPDDPAFANGLLELFLVQKAAYEISYELANRPAWAQIPLRGLLGLLGDGRAALEVH